MSSLSNMRQFPSNEHAFQWKKAVDIGEDEIAEEILSAEHAGIAKGVAK